MKRIISLALVLLIAFSLCVTAFAAAPTEYNLTKGTLYFTLKGSGWKNVETVFCHIWEEGKDPFYSWQAKKTMMTAEGDDLYSFDLAAHGITLEEGTQYCVIFSEKGGNQTYDLLFDTSMLPDVCYTSPDFITENPLDSQKSTQLGYWENADPEQYGPFQRITSLGNVVGTCRPAGVTAQMMLAGFLTGTLDNARAYAEKTDQQLIDDIGAALGMTIEEVAAAIEATGSDAEWKAEDSDLPNEGEGPLVVHLNEMRMSYTADQHPLIQASVQANEVPAVIKGRLAFDQSMMEIPSGLRGVNFPALDTGAYGMALRNDGVGGYFFTMELHPFALNVDEILNKLKMNKGDEYEGDRVDGGPGFTYRIPVFDAYFNFLKEEGVAEVTLDIFEVNNAQGENVEDRIISISLDTKEDEPVGRLLGDVNGDGKVSVADATRIQRFCAKICSLDGGVYVSSDVTDAQMSYCDVTGDGKVSVADATRIQRFCAKICNLDGTKPYVDVPGKFHENEEVV